MAKAPAKKADAGNAKAVDMRTKTDDQLNDQLVDLKREAFNLRFQAATGQLESHGRLRAVRKDIARIYTVMRERELGIIDDPSAQEGTGA